MLCQLEQRLFCLFAALWKYKSEKVLSFILWYIWRVPIARSPLHSPPISWKSSGISNHVHFGQCGRVEINKLLQLDHQIFLVSVDQYMQVFAPEEFQPPPITDIYRETLKRYHDKGPPSSTLRLFRTLHTSLSYHSHAFCKSRQIAHAEFTKRSQRSHTFSANMRRRQPKRKRSSIIR